MAVDQEQTFLYDLNGQPRAVAWDAREKFERENPGATRVRLFSVDGKPRAVAADAVERFTKENPAAEPVYLFNRDGAPQAVAKSALGRYVAARAPESEKGPNVITRAAAWAGDKLLGNQVAQAAGDLVVDAATLPVRLAGAVGRAVNPDPAPKVRDVISGNVERVELDDAARDYRPGAAARAAEAANRYRAERAAATAPQSAAGRVVRNVAGTAAKLVELGASQGLALPIMAAEGTADVAERAAANGAGGAEALARGALGGAAETAAFALMPGGGKAAEGVVRRAVGQRLVRGAERAVRGAGQEAAAKALPKALARGVAAAETLGTAAREGLNSGAKMAASRVAGNVAAGDPAMQGAAEAYAGGALGGAIVGGAAGYMRGRAIAPRVLRHARDIQRESAEAAARARAENARRSAEEFRSAADVDPNAPRRVPEQAATTAQRAAEPPQELPLTAQTTAAAVASRAAAQQSAAARAAAAQNLPASAEGPFRVNPSGEVESRNPSHFAEAALKAARAARGDGGGGAAITPPQPFDVFAPPRLPETPEEVIEARRAARAAQNPIARTKDESFAAFERAMPGATPWLSNFGFKNYLALRRKFPNGFDDVVGKSEIVRGRKVKREVGLDTWAMALQELVTGHSHDANSDMSPREVLEILEGEYQTYRKWKADGAPDESLVGSEGDEARWGYRQNALAAEHARQLYDDVNNPPPPLTATEAAERDAATEEGELLRDEALAMQEVPDEPGAVSPPVEMPRFPAVPEAAPDGSPPSLSAEAMAEADSKISAKRKEVAEYGKRFGNVISGDNARAMLGADPARPETHAGFAKDVDRIVSGAFNQAVQSVRRNKGGVVVFTGGGNGAGKSTVVDGFQGATAIFDSTMTVAAPTREKINAVLNAGGKPLLAFVYRDPLDAWRGVRNRMNDGGHGVTPEAFARSHAEARKTFQLLAREFGDRVEVAVFENDGVNPPRPISLDELARKPDYTKEQLHDYIKNEVNRPGDGGVQAEAGRARALEPEAGAGALAASAAAAEAGTLAVGRSPAAAGLGAFAPSAPAAARSASPLQRHYRQLKQEAPEGSLLALRLGDFYEFFGDDAKQAAAIGDLALTHRSGEAMCGIPVHALDAYLAKFERAGCTVALADRLETPTGPGKPSRREITRIVGDASPGGWSGGNQIVQEAWPEEFPKAVVHTTLAALKRHPDFDAAKRGDAAAARRLVAAVVKPEKIKALVARHPGALVVAVHAEEAGGENKIPVMFAAELVKSGLEGDRDIVQSVKAGRTGQDAWYRITHRPKFEGAVQAGREYILVDDALTQGGTMAELRDYIEKRGGKVVEITGLTAEKGSTTIALRPATLERLRSKFGPEIEHELKASGIVPEGFADLTESEARYLLLSSPDTLRNRLLATRSANDMGLRPGGDGHTPADQSAPAVGTGALSARPTLPPPESISKKLEASGVPVQRRGAAVAAIQQELFAVDQMAADGWMYPVARQAGARGGKGAAASKRTVYTPEEKKRAFRAIASAEHAKANPADAALARKMLGEGVTVTSVVPELWSGEKLSWPIRGFRIEKPADLAALAQLVRSPYQESVKVVFLDKRGRVIDARVSSLGTIDGATVDPGTMLGRAPEDTYGVMVSHNHPSGDPSPSAQDLRVTHRLADACRLLGYKLLDHVITDGTAYHSMRSMDDTDFSGATVKGGAMRKGEKAAPQLKPQVAEWEAVAASRRPAMTSRAIVQDVAARFRSTDTGSAFVVMMDKKCKLVGVSKMTPEELAKPESWRDIILKVQSVREASCWMLVTGDAGADVKSIIGSAADRVINKPLVDVMYPGADGALQSALATAVRDSGWGSIDLYDSDWNRLGLDGERTRRYVRDAAARGGDELAVREDGPPVEEAPGGGKKESPEAKRRRERAQALREVQTELKILLDATPEGVAKGADADALESLARRAEGVDAFATAAQARRKCGSYKGSPWGTEGGMWPLDVPPAAKLSLPEMVDLAHTLSSSGAVPQIVRRAARWRGVFRAYRRQPDSGRVALVSNLFQVVDADERTAIHAQAVRETPRPENPDSPTELAAWARGVSERERALLTAALQRNVRSGPKPAMAVLMHEIGHWIDFLPEGELTRGNVLGHIAALHRYVRKTLYPSLEAAAREGAPGMTSADREALRRQVEKGLRRRDFGSDEEFAEAKSAAYKQAVADFCAERHLQSAPEIREEMESLVSWFMQSDGCPDYYRRSATELYAQAFSAWVNYPAHAAARAPRFAALMDGWLDAHGAGAKALRAMQEGVSQRAAEAAAHAGVGGTPDWGNPATFAWRGKAADAAAAAESPEFRRALSESPVTPSVRRAQLEAERLNWTVGPRAMIETLITGTPADWSKGRAPGQARPFLFGGAERVAASEQRLADGRALTDCLAQLDNTGNLAKIWRYRFDSRVKTVLEAAAVPMDTFRNFLQWSRIAREIYGDNFDRGSMNLANPGGETPGTARAKLDALYQHQRDIFDACEAARQRFWHDVRCGEDADGEGSIMQIVKRSPVLSKEQRDHLCGNEWYVAFRAAVVPDNTRRMSRGEQSVWDGIFSRKSGDFREVGDVIANTMVQDFTMAQQILRQEARLRLVDYLRAHKPDWIGGKAPMRIVTGKDDAGNPVVWQEPEQSVKKGWRTLVFHRNGKLEGCWVPDFVAQALEPATMEGSKTDKGAKISEWVAKYGRAQNAALTVQNTKFQLVNALMRDPNGVAMHALPRRLRESATLVGKVAGVLWNVIGDYPLALRTFFDNTAALLEAGKYDAKVIHALASAALNNTAGGSGYASVGALADEIRQQGRVEMTPDELRRHWQSFGFSQERIAAALARDEGKLKRFFNLAARAWSIGPGRINERLGRGEIRSKAASLADLERRYPDMSPVDRAWWVRNMMGTPDLANRPIADRSPVFKVATPFFTPFAHGLKYQLYESLRGSFGKVFASRMAGQIAIKVVAITAPAICAGVAAARNKEYLEAKARGAGQSVLDALRQSRDAWINLGQMWANIPLRHRINGWCMPWSLARYAYTATEQSILPLESLILGLIGAATRQGTVGEAIAGAINDAAPNLGPGVATAVGIATTIRGGSGYDINMGREIVGESETHPTARKIGWSWDNMTGRGLGILPSSTIERWIWGDDDSERTRRADAVPGLDALPGFVIRKSGSGDLERRRLAQAVIKQQQDTARIAADDAGTAIVRQNTRHEAGITDERAEQRDQQIIDNAVEKIVALDIDPRLRIKNAAERAERRTRNLTPSESFVEETSGRIPAAAIPYLGPYGRAMLEFDDWQRPSERPPRLPLLQRLLP